MKLFIEGRRDGYSPEQCYETMTVGELINFLNQYDKDIEVYLKNDNGYTYGSISEYSIEEYEDEIEDDEIEDYDIEEFCPHCDHINKLNWDGESRTMICKNCGEEILLCSLCDIDECDCNNCPYKNSNKK